MSRERLERETGIEPATNGLGSRYSAIELLPRSVEEILAGPVFDVMPRKAGTLEATRAFQLCSE